MAKTASNIVIGAPATIICAAEGVVEGSGVDLGSTVGGMKIKPKLTLYKKKADQWNGPVGTPSVVDSEYTFEFVLAEVTTANLAYAMGLPTTAAASATSLVAGNTTVATVRTLYVNSNAVAGGLSKWTLHRVVFEGDTEIDMNKEKQTNIKVSGFLLLDTAQAAGEEYFSLAYSATDTTPPTVAMTTPAEDGTVVKEAKGTVTLTFTESANAIDQGTLIYGNADGATIFINDVTDATNTSLVAGTISYNAATKVLTFTPDSNWTASAKHQIIITTGVRDTAGNHLANTFYGHFTVTA